MGSGSSRDEVDIDAHTELESSMKELERTQLQFNQTVGKGRYGTVYFATARDIIEGELITDVAVKKLGDNPAIDVIRLEREVQSLQHLPPHDNIVKIYGWCTEEREVQEDHSNDEATNSSPRGADNINTHYILIVMEHAQQGSLKEYLTEHEKDLKPADLLRFARQICLGMHHLASHKIVHRNLGSRNIMMMGESLETVQCKISDFELALTLPTENDTFREKERIRLEVRWMAPECLREGCFSIKSDVWAFGVVMWEIFSLGARPYDKEKSSYKVARDVQKGSLRLQCPKPEHCERKWFDNIMKPCWNNNPTKRPDFNKLERLLAEALKGQKIELNSVKVL